MKPKSSLSCLQQPATGPYPESEEVSPFVSRTNFFMMNDSSEN
jgi:hypothetical protein